MEFPWVRASLHKEPWGLSGCYIRSITAKAELEKISLAVGLKGPDAKKN
jgi:hypothetical protein